MHLLYQKTAPLAIFGTSPPCWTTLALSEAEGLEPVRQIVTSFSSAVLSRDLGRFFVRENYEFRCGAEW